MRQGTEPLNILTTQDSYDMAIGVSSMKNPVIVRFAGVIECVEVSCWLTSGRFIYNDKSALLHRYHLCPTGRRRYLAGEFVNVV